MLFFKEGEAGHKSSSTPTLGLPCKGAQATGQHVRAYPAADLVHQTADVVDGMNHTRQPLPPAPHPFPLADTLIPGWEPPLPSQPSRSLARPRPMLERTSEPPPWLPQCRRPPGGGGSDVTRSQWECWALGAGAPSGPGCGPQVTSLVGHLAPKGWGQGSYPTEMGQSSWVGGGRVQPSHWAAALNNPSCLRS